MDVKKSNRVEGVEPMAEDLFKSPVIQEIIMSNRIGAIALELSKRLNIEPVKALERFLGAKPVATFTTSQPAYIFTPTCLPPRPPA